MAAYRKNGSPLSLKNRWVRFRICDARVPERDEILRELHGRDLLQGRIVDLSDAGFEHGAFAVVEVSGLHRPVVVPVTKVLAIPDEPA